MLDGKIQILLNLYTFKLVGLFLYLLLVFRKLVLWVMPFTLTMCADAIYFDVCDFYLSRSRTSRLLYIKTYHATLEPLSYAPYAYIGHRSAPYAS